MFLRKYLLTVLILIAMQAMVYADRIALFCNDIGAYPSALGGAMSAEFGSVHSQYYNPAACAYLPRITLESTLFTIYDTGIKEVSFLYPSQYGVFSVALVYGSLDGLLYSGLDSNNRPTYTGGSFGYNAMKLLLGWSDGMVNLAPDISSLDKLYVGAQLDYEAESLEKATGSFFAINLGGLYKYNDNLFLGLAIENILKAQETWSGTGKAVEDIDLLVNTGIKYILIPEQLSVNLDYPLLVSKPKLKAGVSYSLMPGISLLAGTGDSAANLGIKACYNGFVFDCSYSSAKYEFLSDAYRFSLGMDFGPGESRAAAKAQSPEDGQENLLAEYKTANDGRKVAILTLLADPAPSGFFEFLLAAIKQDGALVKLAGIKLLVDLYPEEAVNPLMDSLFDTNKNVKILAAFYLGNMGDGKVAGVINQIIPFETDPAVLQAFETALSKLKSKI